MLSLVYSIDMKAEIVSYLFAFQHCLICKRKFEGIVCKHCKNKFIVRSEPFCIRCGIQLLSEIQFCTVCREATDLQNKKDSIEPSCFIYSLWNYTEVLRKLIYEYKNNSFRALRYFFYSELYKYINTHILSSKISKIAVIPLPANPKKVLKRGFDQSKIMAKSLATEKQIDCFFIFHRDKMTKEQKHLSAKERSENMLQALQLKKTVDISMLSTYETIILLDDIVTTGSTMQTAFRVLYKKYKEVMETKPLNIIGLSLVRID